MPRSPKTIAVYLGSSGHTRPVFREAAERMGRIIAESGCDLVYGGMDAGLMGLLAGGAVAAGGKVTGIVPRNLKDSERVLQGVFETIMVEDLWQRKRMMFGRADAVAVLPGGYGTLDEMLEVLYWRNKNLHRKPVVLVNMEGFWMPLLAYLDTLEDYRPEFLTVVENVNDVIPALRKLCDGDACRSADTGDFPHFEDEIVRGTQDSILIDEASVENTYYAVCALGLKQLGRHQRPIGFLNTGGQFDRLLEWFGRAALETFLTEKCLKLFAVDSDEDSLRAILKRQEAVTIDLHTEKWGVRPFSD